MSTLFGADVHLLRSRGAGVAALPQIEADVEFLEKLSIRVSEFAEPVDPSAFELKGLTISAPNGARYFPRRTVYSRNDPGARVRIGEYTACRDGGGTWVQAPELPAIVVKAMLSPTEEHHVVRNLNRTDARRARPGCDRIPAAVLWPGPDSPSGPTKNRHLCIVAMAKAAGDLSTVRRTLTPGPLTMWESLMVVRGVLEEVKACYEAYEYLHMDVKDQNFLFSRGRAGNALRVVLSDYGGLAEDGELTRPTYPPLDSQVAPALEKTCLSQFAPLLLQVMGARDQVKMMHSHSGPDGIWQAYADLFGMRTARINMQAYAWIAFCSRYRMAIYPMLPYVGFFGSVDVEAEARRARSGPAAAAASGEKPFVDGEGRWFTLRPGLVFSSTFDGALSLLDALISRQGVEEGVFSA